MPKLFVYDYSSRRLLKYEWRDLHVVREAAGVRLTASHRYDPVLDRTRVDLQLEGDGVIHWTEIHHHYTVEPYLVDELAAANGLRVQSVRDIDRDAFSSSSLTHVYVLEHAAIAADAY